MENSVEHFGEQPLPTSDKRSLTTAIGRGLRGRCPNCGVGGQFDGFLKIVDECPNCSTELHHHRADDLPPYLTIFVVGHIVISIVMMVEARWDISTLAFLSVGLPLTALLSLALMRPMKGAVVGLQWALGMHGFGEEQSTP